MKERHRGYLSDMILAFGLMLLIPPVFAAGEPEQASRCMSCHGPGGISQNPAWPNLAGQKAPYLSGQLKAFRDGSRKNGMMENVVNGLTDTDIRQLSAYFSQLPPTHP